MYMIIDGVFRSDKKQVDEYKQLLRPLIHYDRRTGTFPLWCVWSWWQSALYTASQRCLRAVCRVATRLGVQCSRASRAFCVSLMYNRERDARKHAQRLFSFELRYKMLQVSHCTLYVDNHWKRQNVTTIRHLGVFSSRH